RGGIGDGRGEAGFAFVFRERRDLGPDDVHVLRDGARLRERRGRRGERAEGAELFHRRRGERFVQPVGPEVVVGGRGDGGHRHARGRERGRQRVVQREPLERVA